MKFCSNCGNVIKENEKICSVCGQPAKEPINYGSNSDMESYPIPSTDSQTSKKKSGAGPALITVIIITAIVILVICMGNYKGSEEEEKFSSYNIALDALADGLTKSDGKAICHTMLTDEMMNDITQEQFDSMSETISFLNSTVSDVTGEKAEWSFKVKSSVKLSDDKIDSIKYYYSIHIGMGIEISEAYQVKVKMKFGYQSDYVYINVIKVPDEGWKVSEEFLNTVMGFGSYDLSC